VLLDGILEASARREPDRAALVAGGRRVSFGALDAQVNRLAHALRRADVRHGDRVVILLDRSVEAVAALFATLRAGAAFVMLDPSARLDRIAFVLDDTRAAALILPGRRLGELADELARAPHLRAVFVTGDAGVLPPLGKALLDLDAASAPGVAPDTPPERSTIDLDLAALLYTSGSTGEPRAVMLTHGNILAATRSIAAYLRLVEDDVLFCLLPLSFGYGLTQLFSAFFVGARLVVEGGTMFAGALLRRIAEERATGLGLVPTMAALFLRADLAGHDLSALRYMTSAGAALPPEQARRLRAALPHVKLVAMYGQTECMRALYLEPDELDRRPGSVGRGMPNQQLFLLDERGEEAAPGEVGELLVRGAHVMRGYWQRPDETARKLRPLPPALAERAAVPADEKLLYTGDLFRRDDAGYFYFVGRRDDVFKSRGLKVSPYEVERAVYELDGIVDAAVIGVPHPVLGRAVKAIVVADGRITAEDVRRHCAARLDDHLVPHEVEFRSELPKNERGKIVRRDL
jgi:amino acid adenylation domain-containing protein